ncbi:MAG: ATP-binding protein [Treponema sp.]|nr:ATP-binding protein [Treponema sp.]
MRFLISDSWGNLPPNKKSPFLFLEPNPNWNDFGYYVLFKLYYQTKQNQRIEIGYIRILDTTNERTTLTEFQKLDSKYISIGVGEGYYRTLKQLFKDETSEILKSLNDCVIDDNLRANVNKDEWIKALFRDQNVEELSNSAKDILTGISSAFMQDFSYKCRIGFLNNEHDIAFDFREKWNGYPNRIIALIGENGTGKTQYLANLALGLSGQDKELSDSKNFEKGRPIFKKVIALSFSLFDSFKQPERTSKFMYFYFGFKDKKGHLLSEEKIQKNLISSFKELEKMGRKSDWIELLEKSISIEALQKIEEKFNEYNEDIYYTPLPLSSGQNIILNYVTHILGSITENSLLLIDEPEIHLHPNAISKLIEIFYCLLEKYNSYAIVATHSPIIVQQIPSSHVRVLKRDKDFIFSTILPNESFGENLTTITDHVFGKISEKEYYKIVLERLLCFYKPEEIEGKLFSDKLSLNATLYLRNYRNEIE